MRPFLAIVTALALAFGSLRECTIYLSFALNRSYIAKNLCEKRDEPGNTCQGRCQLCKQLDGEEHGAQAPAPLTTRNLDNLQPVTLPSDFDMIAPEAWRTLVEPTSYELPPPPADLIDHPPESLAG